MTSNVTYGKTSKLTQEEMDRRKALRIANQAFPGMVKGHGNKVDTPESTASEKANLIANRSTSGRTTTDPNKEVLREVEVTAQPVPVPVQRTQAPIGQVPFDSSLAGAPSGPAHLQNRAVRPTANAQQLDNAVTATSNNPDEYRNILNRNALLSEQANVAKINAFAPGQQPQGVGKPNTAVPYIENQRQGIINNLTANAPVYEEPSIDAERPFVSTKHNFNRDEGLATLGLRNETANPSIGGFIEDIKNDPSATVKSVSDTLTKWYNSATGKMEVAIKDGQAAPVGDSAGIETTGAGSTYNNADPYANPGQMGYGGRVGGNLGRKDRTFTNTAPPGNPAASTTSYDANPYTGVSNDPRVRYTSPINFPRSPSGGLRIGGGSARGGRMAQVLADNRVKYADRHAREQSSALRRTLRNTSGGRPGMANRKAFADDIANQRTTAAFDRRTNANSSLRNNELASLDRYRQDSVELGYSEMDAATATARRESLDSAIETTALGYANSDEDDAGVQDRNAAANESYIRAFLPSDIASQSPEVQQQSILAGAALSRGSQYLMQEGSFGIHGPDDLMNFRIEGGKALYEKLGKSEPTLWDVITTDVTLWGDLWGDMVIRGPGGKGKASFGQFMSRSGLSARQLNAIAEYRKR